MTQTHTPGPWHVTKSGTHICAPPCDHFPNGQIICAIKGGPGSKAQENARLISACPDMLDALQRIFIRATNAPNDDEERAWQEFTRIMDIARAAIAKATR